MRSKALILLILSASLALTACSAGTAIGSGAGGSSSKPESSLASAVELGGQFNEETFDKLCENITLGDKKISLPFTISDLGEGYELADAKGVIAVIRHNGTTIAACGISPGDSQQTIDEGSEITTLMVYKSDGEEAAKSSFGGITFESSKADIISALGEPSSEDDNDTQVILKYSLHSGGKLSFNINNDKLFSILIER